MSDLSRRIWVRSLKVGDYVMILALDDPFPQRAKVCSVHPSRPMGVPEYKGPGPFVVTTGGWIFDGNGNSSPFESFEVGDPPFAEIHPWTPELTEWEERRLLVKKLKRIKFHLLPTSTLKKLDSVVREGFLE